jgi:hypothetical protein
MDPGISMRRAPRVLLLVSVSVATTAWGQTRIGEIRVFGAAAWAPGADVSARPDDGYPLPRSRAMAGAGASLSFVAGDLSGGPEAMVLRGSDRKLFAVGGVARLGMARGRVRPYILLGAGIYTWNHKASLPPGWSSPGQPTGPHWLGSVTQLAGNAGGGVVVGREGLSLIVEVRGHKSLAEDELEGARNALGLSVGGRVAW